MSALLKRIRWAVLLMCYRVVVMFCGLFRIALPMDSFWRPHNLRRFTPSYVSPRIEIQLQIPPQPR
jgi:hypothetical protein